VCKAGQCEVGYCPEGLSCEGWLGCPGYYLPLVDRTCTTDQDCVLVPHVASCCVTVQAAVRATEQALFEALEQQCRSIHDVSFFSCGCAGSTTTENGASAGPGQSIAAACVGGTCTAVVTGGLTCGAMTCDAGQSCCTTPGDGGYCIYSCADSCPLVVDDAGGHAACRG
jgi:hypothetical protein